MGGFGRDPIPGLGPTLASPIHPARLKPETARLRVLNGPGAGREFKLDGLRMRIGRSDPPAIVVDIDLTDCELGVTPMVSRRHAEVQWVDSELRLVDLGSGNGTWVEDRRLQATGVTPNPEPATLRTGSRVRFANLECEIFAAEE